MVKSETIRNPNHTKNKTENFNSNPDYVSDNSDKNMTAKQRIIDRINGSRGGQRTTVSTNNLPPEKDENVLGTVENKNIRLSSYRTTEKEKPNEKNIIKIN